MKTRCLVLNSSSGTIIWNWMTTPNETQIVPKKVCSQNIQLRLQPSLGGDSGRAINRTVTANDGVNALRQTNATQSQEAERE